TSTTRSGCSSGRWTTTGSQAPSTRRLRIRSPTASSRRRSAGPCTAPQSCRSPSSPSPPCAGASSPTPSRAAPGCCPGARSTWGTSSSTRTWTRRWPAPCADPCQDGDVKLEGVHHITAITGDAQKNVDFYAGVLGLRLVKKTVNQDDPTVYHLF